MARWLVLLILLGLFNSIAFGEAFIVEYNDPKAPVRFKYDKREYKIAFLPERLQGTLIFAGEQNDGKKESLCQDKKYNKHFCPKISFSLSGYKVWGIHDFKPKDASSVENLDWHIPNDTLGVLGSVKYLRTVLPAKYNQKDWSQVEIELVCNRFPKNGGKEFFYEGQYSYTKKYYFDSLKSAFKVYVSDTIYSTIEGTGADRTDPDVVRKYLQQSKFFEENYCLNNEALKNWDIGNHARMLIDSIRPNLEYFKKFVEENRARESQNAKDQTKKK